MSTDQTGHATDQGRWTERYRGAVMNTFGPPRLVLARGAGAHVWDADGRRYTDLLGGIAVNALGHAHPALVAAVTDQLSTLGHISNFYASAPQVELAETLLALLGHGPGRVFLTNSGTEAVEAAFKLTRRTGRTHVVAAAGGFHGRTMGALALTSKAAYREPFAPLPGEVTFVPYGDAAALAAAVTDSTAAVLLEPVQGEAGVVVPPEGYLAAARRTADEHGALLWLDEIQTGIGRTGLWFEHHRHEVRPDVVTVAKGLGGGFPIGACIALGAAGDLLQPGNHGSTFGGNPVACAAALAVLRTLRDDGLLAAAVERGEQLRTGLSGQDAVAHTTGHGLLVGVQLDADLGPEVVTAAQQAGFLLNATGPARLRLAPPLVLGADDVTAFLDAWAGIVASARAAAVPAVPAGAAGTTGETGETE